jgi:hypothetical protein
MKTKKSERGQALAEYMPLIPPVLLLSVLILIPLAENSSDIFCRMVNAMEPETCEVITVDEEEELPEDDCIIFHEIEGASQCDKSGVCTLFEMPGPSVWYPSEPIETVIIKAGTDYYKFNSPGSNDGCYNVAIEDDRIEWELIGDEEDCHDISNVQAWEALICVE